MNMPLPADVAPLVHSLDTAGRPVPPLDLIWHLDRRTPHRWSGSEIVVAIILAKDFGLVREVTADEAKPLNRLEMYVGELLELTPRGRAMVRTVA